MLYILSAALCTALCLLPVTVKAGLHCCGSARWTLRVTCAGLHRTRHSGDGRAASRLRPSRLRLLASSLRRADRARQFLLRHTRLEALDALILLRTGDAALSALVTGSLQSLAALPAVRRRNVRIRVLPEFFRPHSSVQARCIIRLRLGTIILTMLMLLAAAFRQRQMQKARNWYGTSHW